MSGALWFRAKRHGWGWTPVTWQGWLLTALYAIAVGAWAIYLTTAPEAIVGGDRGAALLWSAWPILLLTVVFAGVCWIKGERPRWRWGK